MDKLGLATAFDELPIYEVGELLRLGLTLLIRRGLATLEDIKLLAEIEGEPALAQAA